MELNSAGYVAGINVVLEKLRREWRHDVSDKDVRNCDIVKIVGENARARVDLVKKPKNWREDLLDTDDVSTNPYNRELWDALKRLVVLNPVRYPAGRLSCAAQLCQELSEMSNLSLLEATHVVNLAIHKNILTVSSDGAVETASMVTNTDSAYSWII